MAVKDVVGVNRTLFAAGGLSVLGHGLTDARVKCMVDTYVADATEDAGSTIKLFPDLPKGARVLLIVLAASVAQAALTFALGDGDSADRYVTAGATGLQTALTPVVAGGAGYVIGTADNDEYILLTTAVATMTAGTITAYCFYTQD
ncbi:MAG: hypothetical protein WC404_00225 [Candidatus Omnitrophota bacterium]|jgi:hypothetical protein